MDSSPSGALSWLDEKEHQRRAAGLRRTLHPRPPTTDHIDLASNDYLGLATHPQVINGAIEALTTWGAGATGSRLVTGDTQLHHTVEQQLADFVGTETGLIFSSGYTANIGAVVSLGGPDTLIISDRYNHASLIDACRLARSPITIVEHCDIDHIEHALAHRDQPRGLVVTESVFSADGQLAPLRELYEVTHRHQGILLVDEAHGLGIRGQGGRGLAQELGLVGAHDLVITATLSKSLGSQGGVVLGSRKIRSHLIDSARTFIFDTGLTPPALGAAKAALHILWQQPDLANKVLHHANRLAYVCGHTQPASSAVVSVILGNPDRAVNAAQQCWQHGLRVGCFRPPSVPEGTSRLRLTARASLTNSDLEQAQHILTHVLRSV